jgi:hypothetical protein
MQPFSVPLSLPFLPSPLPDEIFGSWLGRLAVTNGLQSKSGFLKWLGVPKRLRRIAFADMVPPAASTFHVLSTLGLAYAECLARFSTRPYWESMHASAEDGDAAGRSNDGSPSLSFRGVPSKSSGKDRGEAFFRACPECLHHDWLELGACYFHRSHQLKGSRVCHKHGLPLLSNCPMCKGPLGDVRSLLVISTHCRCEADLTTLRHRQVDQNDVWWKLATFENRCLNSAPGSLEIPRILGYLRHSLRTSFPESHGVRAKRALEHTFGEDGTDWLRRGSRKQTGQAKRTTSNVSLTTSTVQVYTALFTACDISFETALTEAAAFAPSQGQLRKPAQRRSGRPTTVEVARQRFLEFFADKKAVGWAPIRSTRPFVFWLLALEDLPWLQAKLPPRPVRAGELVPSIGSDRKTLLTCEPDLALGNRLTKRLHNAAVRAYYRDMEWLESSMKTSRDRRNAESRDILVLRLEKIWADHCNRPERPKRFKRRDAARGLGTSVKTLLSQASTWDLPHSLIEEDLWTFRRRALKWAVKERLAQGLSLAPSMVRQLAGVSPLVSTDQVAAVINDIRSELSD